MAKNVSAPMTGRWYPNTSQLKDPGTLERSFRQVLDHLYRLQDQHNALQQAHGALLAKVGAQGTAASPPPGSGPTDSMILGLHVEPVDTNSLANGAALKYNSARGTFSFQ